MTAFDVEAVRQRLAACALHTAGLDTREPGADEADRLQHYWGEKGYLYRFARADLEATLDALTETRVALDQARAVLAFYAEPSNWERETHRFEDGSAVEAVPLAVEDRGAAARAAPRRHRGGDA